jgi:hypothetical protein
MCDLPRFVGSVVNVEYLPGVGSSFIPNPIFVAKFGCMKLSVAPESTSARLSAMKQLVRIDTGILIER